MHADTGREADREAEAERHRKRGREVDGSKQRERLRQRGQAVRISLSSLLL